MSSQVASRRPPTSTEVIARQKADAARALAARPAAPLPAVAAVDNRTPQQRYIDEVAPANMEGRLVKFSKDGKFITNDDGETIGEDVDFIALCDETLVGWIKFNGKDTPPDRHMGLLYSDFVMPTRDSLGDLDASQWEAGLSGHPEDPWRSQSCLAVR